MPSEDQWHFFLALNSVVRRVAIMAKRLGRSKGSRNRGYFFRAERGWYTKLHGKFVPLTDDAGERLRSKETDSQVLLEAYARHLLEHSSDEDQDSGGKVPESADAEVGAVCAAYLDHLRMQTGDIGPSPKGTAKTFVDRGQTLFDFCYGLPGEFFCNGDKEARTRKLDAEKKRVHDGFGAKLCSELGPADIDSWLKAHKWTPGGWRTRVQAVKRAMNFGVERKLIAQSPIKGYRLPKSNARITYLTETQEAAMIAHSSPAFAHAIKICIRTGARFGCEFAALCARHVRDHKDKMEWVFKPEESKTKILRTIRITDPDIIAIVRERLNEVTDGSPLFRNKSGKPWDMRLLSNNFRRVKRRLAKKKIRLDTDACMYSCRHTYAKRTLEGHWTGKPASLSTLARLMGNSIQVCIAHYLQFSVADNEGLWGSA